jgi:hypothetical protein
MDNVRATAEGFEAHSLDVTAYAHTREQAVRLLAREPGTKRPKTRKGRALSIGEEAAAPAAPRGRKLLVSLPIDTKRSLLVTEPAKPVKQRKSTNDWEFHGNLGHIVVASPPGVAHEDHWNALVVDEPFDDLDPRVVRSMPRSKQTAAYKNGYRSKLGGYPYFPQRELVTACFRCGQPLELFAQLGDSVADFMGDWLLYVFLCPKGCEARIASQS